MVGVQVVNHFLIVQEAIDDTPKTPAHLGDVGEGAAEKRPPHKCKWCYALQGQNVLSCRVDRNVLLAAARYLGNLRHRQES